MYCPQCASANQDDAKFCRTCGANLSLIGQALSGSLPEPSSGKRRRQLAKSPSEPAPNLGQGITQAFLGLGFLLVTLAVFLFAPGGRHWWFWMLIPTFGILGKGVSEIVNAVMHQKTLAAPPAPNALPNAAPANLPASGYRTRNTGDLIPPSVTEGTTRHLEEVELRPKEKV